MTSPSLSSTVRRSDEPLSASLPDGLVLFSAARGSYYAFDPLTTDIWERLAEPVVVAALCRTLEDRFDVTPAQCEADVLQLLAALHTRGLIRIVST